MCEKNILTKEIIKYVKQITKSSGSSFYYAMRLLPASKRNAMFVIYSFCRIVDDIADGDLEISVKKQMLSDWKKIINSIYAGNVPKDNKIAEALSIVIKNFNLPKQEFIEIILGMEMDMDSSNFPFSENDLQLYCRRVAGAVGILSVYVFGCKDKDSIDFAISLGNALQLTNILRDSGEDIQMGRLYFPKELLDKYHINYSDKDLILKSNSIGLLRAELGGRAKKEYEKANSLLNDNNKKQLRPALIMQKSYYMLFEKLAKRGWDICEPRIRLSFFEKLKALF